MAFAVTHILITIIILDLLRHYYFGKKKFPRYLLVVGGIAGLAPDIDIPLTWVWNAFTGSSGSLHGMFSHSLIFAAFFAILGCYLGSDLSFLKGKKQRKKWSNIFYVIAFGWMLHVFLDCLFGGYRHFLWPFGVDTLAFCPDFHLSSHAVSIDAILLVLWFIHEEMHGLVKDYW